MFVPTWVRVIVIVFVVFSSLGLFNLFVPCISYSIPHTPLVASVPGVIATVIAPM